jgi:nitrate reductase gamma subunit
MCCSSKSSVLSVGVLWLRRLVACLSRRRLGFVPMLVHVGFVVDKVVLGHVLLRVLRLSPVNSIPPWLFVLIYHLGMNNRLVGGRSSETWTTTTEIQPGSRRLVSLEAQSV